MEENIKLKRKKKEKEKKSGKNLLVGFLLSAREGLAQKKKKKKKNRRRFIQDRKV